MCKNVEQYNNEKDAVPVGKFNRTASFFCCLRLFHGIFIIYTIFYHNHFEITVNRQAMMSGQQDKESMKQAMANMEGLSVRVGGTDRRQIRSGAFINNRPLLFQSFVLLSESNLSIPRCAHRSYDPSVRKY